jgi:Uma2 family endonuclease
MYYPIANPVSLVQEDFGVWAPPEHQRVISKLTMHLGILYRIDKTITLEPLPETMLDESKASEVPDLVLRNNQTAQTPVIIEVCHTAGLKGDLRKVIQLIDADLYGIREGFIYDYKTGNWLRYRFGDNGSATPDSFSEVLNVELSGFV